MSETFLEGRLEISLLDENGAVLETHFGPTKQEQLEDHLAGECGFMCSFCYTEACL